MTKGVHVVRNPRSRPVYLVSYQTNIKEFFHGIREKKNYVKSNEEYNVRPTMSVERV
mgnify:CR=1 FL=1